MFIRNDKKESYIRVLHASPDTPPVDIYVNGAPLFKNLAYENFTEYVPLGKGTYKVDLYPAGKDETPILTQNVDIPENEVITVVATGNLNDIQLVSYMESNPKDLPHDKSRLRFINLSPDSPELDVWLDGEVAFKDVGFLDATNYLNLPAGTYIVGFDIADTKDKVLELKTEVKGEKVYTMYILGDMSNLTSIQSLDGSTYMRY
ncbi:MAG: DUF4397 domain-containing protein [Terrisporobacter sp.]